MERSKSEQIKQIAQLIRELSPAIAFTGAGISTESGIPDYRSENGIYKRQKDAETLADFNAYVSNPEIRKKAWALQIRSPIHEALPNLGHRALAELCKYGYVSHIITQNIDRLHHKSAVDPKAIFELHGDVERAVCLRCHALFDMKEILARVKSGDLDPRCELSVSGIECGGILKANTISFGQPLDSKVFDHCAKLMSNTRLVIVIGTSLSVSPANSLVEHAKFSSAKVVIINDSQTQYDALADIVLIGKAGEVLTSMRDVLVDV